MHARRWSRIGFVLGTALALAGPWSPGFAAVTEAEASAEGIAFFEREVRPVLAEHCFQCHGPEVQRAGLRLDHRSAILAGGESGPAAIPGEPGASRVVQAIQYTGRLMMPPDRKLPDEAIEAITDWIAMGAPWPEDDEFISAPEEQETKSEWIERLKRHHWAFAPVEAQAPPEAPFEAWQAHPVDGFVGAKLAEAGLTPADEADRRTLIRRVAFDLTGLPPTAEAVAAFEADTRPDAYERMVDGFLDSSHFGERWARHWLDLARYADTKGYVFQEDRHFPFSYTYRDYVINAFNRDLPYDEFVRHQIAADMMELDEPEPLAALGFLTLGRRFINNVHDITDDRIDVVTRGLLGLTVSCARCHDHMYDPVTADDYYALYGVFRSAREPNEYPLLREPDPEDPSYQEYLEAVQAREDELERVTTEIHRDLMTVSREQFARYFREAIVHQDSDSDDSIKLVAKEAELDWQLLKRWRDYIAARLESPDAVWRPLAWFAEVEANGFTEEAAAMLVTRIREPGEGEEPVNKRIAEAFAGPVPESLGHVARRYANAIQKAERPWLELLAVVSKRAAREGVVPELPTALPDADDEALRQVLYGVDSPANIPRGDAFALSDVPTQGRIRNARNAIANTKATHPGRPDRAMALVDTDPLFDPFVFTRGQPGARGDDVPRRFLEVLAGSDVPPFEHGSGRLELAEAIVDRDNPLTARVFVNRVWGHLFNRPLVDTPSDFGLRSSPPSHPELLDYLAERFIADGWSMKGVIRLIVTSQTYRQASTFVADHADIDPENLLLSRQNRKRLDFEALRDSILQAAGTLDTTLYGHSVDITVAPYPVRRTVYSFIERQNLPGVFRTFDFASPDGHSPARFRTTVPQQALYMMNSPFVVEQARALAERSRGETENDSITAQVETLYGLALQRTPDAEELGLAVRFIEGARPHLPEDRVWRYGYGGFDEETGTVSFTTLPYFGDETWRGGQALPDEKLGWVHLHAKGGHPGKPGYATVLRWVAPVTGEAAISGELRHRNTNGDGVRGYIVLNGKEVLWDGQVKDTSLPTEIERVAVASGDVIDFIVDCGEHENYDGYGWAPEVVLHPAEVQAAEGGDGAMSWHAAENFQGPAPPPLEAWEQYAQVLLLSNEFAFVD